MHATGSAVVLVIEDRPRFAREYRQVLDYLALRVACIRTMPALIGALAEAPPFALIWDLECGLDGAEVTGALAAGRAPLLILGGAEQAARASTMCARSGVAPAHVASCPREVIAFLLHAAREAGLRVLAV